MINPINNINTKNTNNVIENKTDNINENKNIYDVSREKYHDYINELCKTAIDNRTHFASYDTRMHLPYYNVSFYLDKDYSDEDVLKFSKDIFKYFYNEMAKNEYKVPIIRASYDILSLDIYNKTQQYNVPNEYIQYKVKEIKNYTIYEDFIEKNNNYKERGY